MAKSSRAAGARNARAIGGLCLTALIGLSGCERARALWQSVEQESRAHASALESIPTQERGELSCARGACLGKHEVGTLRRARSEAELALLQKTGVPQAQPPVGPRTLLAVDAGSDALVLTSIDAGASELPLDAGELVAPADGGAPSASQALHAGGELRVVEILIPRPERLAPSSEASGAVTHVLLPNVEAAAPSAQAAPVELVPSAAPSPALPPGAQAAPVELAPSAAASPAPVPNGEVPPAAPSAQPAPVPNGEVPPAAPSAQPAPTPSNEAAPAPPTPSNEAAPAPPAPSNEAAPAPSAEAAPPAADAAPPNAGATGPAPDGSAVPENPAPGPGSPANAAPPAATAPAAGDGSAPP